MRETNPSFPDPDEPPGPLPPTRLVEERPTEPAELEQRLDLIDPSRLAFAARQLFHLERDRGMTVRGLLKRRIPLGDPRKSNPDHPYAVNRFDHVLAELRAARRAGSEAELDDIIAELYEQVCSVGLSPDGLICFLEYLPELALILEIDARPELIRDLCAQVASNVGFSRSRLEQEFGTGPDSPLALFDQIMWTPASDTSPREDDGPGQTAIPTGSPDA